MGCCTIRGNTQELNQTGNCKEKNKNYRGDPYVNTSQIINIGQNSFDIVDNSEEEDNQERNEISRIKEIVSKNFSPINPNNNGYESEDSNNYLSFKDIILKGNLSDTNKKYTNFNNKNIENLNGNSFNTDQI